MAVAVLTLAIAHGSATAQPAPPLERAPPLPLDSPATPLTAPVTIAQSGWGPARRICVDRFIVLAEGGVTPSAPRSCMQVEDARHDPAIPGWRLRLGFESARTPGVAFTLLRTDEGRVAELDLASLPPGIPAPTPEQRQAVLADMRAALNAMGLPRQTLGQGGRFSVPLPTEIATQGTRLDRAGLSCVVQGASRIAQRPVLVAQCEGGGEGAITGRTGGSVSIAGRFAVDVETGLLSAQGYVTRLELTQREDGGAPRPAGTMLMATRLRME